MGCFFFPTGKGSFYVACGNRKGGNELRFQPEAQCQIWGHAPGPLVQLIGKQGTMGAVGVRACGAGASVDVCRRTRSRGLATRVCGRQPSCRRRQWVRAGTRPQHRGRWVSERGCTCVRACFACVRARECALYAKRSLLLCLKIALMKRKIIKPR